MTLKSETTVEYTFNDAYLFYCEHHDTLGITESHGDSVQLQGVTQDNINYFIKNYFSMVLNDEPLKEYFNERLDKIKEAARRELYEEEVS